MKIGYEVEGRLKGVRSLFLDVSELDKFYEHFVRCNCIKTVHEVCQIYVSDHSNTLDLFSIKLLNLSKEFLLTVEVTELKVDPPRYINTMLCIDSPSFWFLRSIDQIKISKDLRVFSTTVENMSITNPEEFKNDTEVTLHG
jgi:hypothetical protein